MLVGAARAGEPITDVRLAGPDVTARLTGRPGDAAVPVRLADPEVAGLLGPGSRVDVVTPAPDDDRPVVLAADAAVLTVVAAEADIGSPGRRAAAGWSGRPAACRGGAGGGCGIVRQVAVTLR